MFVVPTATRCRDAIGRAHENVRIALEFDNGADLFRLLSEPKEGDWLWEHAHDRNECGETYKQYKSKMGYPQYRYPGPQCNRIVLCPLGESFSTDLGQRFLRHMQLYCTAYFPGMKVDVLRRRLPLNCVESRRNEHGHPQYLISGIEEMLQMEVPSKSDVFCRLGVTLEDIYRAHNEDFVFGEADGVTRVGVFSFARQSPIFYKGFHATSREAGRLSLSEKMVWIRDGQSTMVHEIGHLFGMAHCAFFHCIMNGYAGVGESTGSSFFCPVCLRKLMRSHKELRDGPPTLILLEERYAQMNEALRALVDEFGVDANASGQRAVRSNRRTPTGGEKGSRRQEHVAKGLEAMRHDVDWLVRRRMHLASHMISGGVPELEADARSIMPDELAALPAEFADLLASPFNECTQKEIKKMSKEERAAYHKATAVAQQVDKLEEKPALTKAQRRKMRVSQRAVRETVLSLDEESKDLIQGS